MNKHTTRGYIPETGIVPSSYMALAILHQSDFHLKATKLPVSGSHYKTPSQFEMAFKEELINTYHPVIQTLWMNVTSRHTSRHAWDKKLVDGWKVKR